MKAITAILIAIGISSFVSGKPTTVQDEAKRIFRLETGQAWPKDVDATDLPSMNDFAKFIERYSKVYQDVHEKFSRFANYQINYLLAKAHDSLEQASAEYGLNMFSDLSYSEIKKYYRNLKTDGMESPPQMAAIEVNPKLPELVDWRTKNAVTPVKNQGQCGSCWTFSTTGNIEGHWAIKKGQLLSLSEQQILDCDSTCFGCDGGWPFKAFEYIKEIGGLETEAAYKYRTEQEQCVSDPGKFTVYVNGSLRISEDEDQMASWLAANGPISVLINAGPLMYYNGGISHPTPEQCPPSGVDHAVLLVGFGTSEEGTPYWIVKNSWGTVWGEEGYFRLYRGAGVCGINTSATSSIIQ